MDPHSGGNAIPEITREEHNHSLGAKNVNLVASPTIYAVVNTSAAGVGQSMVTLFSGPNQIGSVTISHPVSIAGNLTLSNPNTYIGLTTATLGVGNQYVGLASVNVGGSLPGGVNAIGFATVYVANSFLAGNVTLDSGSRTGIVGNLTLSDSKTYIGLVTSTLAGSLPAGINGIGFSTVNVAGVAAGTNYVGLASVNIGGTLPALSAGVAGIGFATVQVASIAAGSNYIGLASVNLGGTLPALTASTVNIGLVSILGGGIALTASSVNVGSVSVLGGGIGLNAGVNGIGFATVQVASIAAGANYIGLASINGSIVNLAGTAQIGSVTVSHPISIAGNITLSDPKSFIGLVTIGGIGTVTLSDPKGYIGLTTTTLGIGTQFIGLVTAWTRNAGTSKTLVPSPWLLTSVGSLSTVAVPTNANTMYITQMVLSSDATVRVNIKSGVTYMTGNVTLGITLNPGGGFVMNGSPDSPVWIGLPSGAIVLEKLDLTATKANIGGSLIYFQE